MNLRKFVSPNALDENHVLVSKVMLTNFLNFPVSYNHLSFCPVENLAMFKFVRVLEISRKTKMYFIKCLVKNQLV